METETLKLRIRSQQRWNKRVITHCDELIAKFSTDQQQVINKLLAGFEASPMTEGACARAMAKRDGERIGEQMQRYKLPEPVTAHGAAIGIAIMRGYVSEGESIVEELTTQLRAIEALQKKAAK